MKFFALLAVALAKEVKILLSEAFSEPGERLMFSINGPTTVPNDVCGAYDKLLFLTEGVHEVTIAALELFDFNDGKLVPAGDKSSGSWIFGETNNNEVRTDMLNNWAAGEPQTANTKAYYDIETMKLTSVVDYNNAQYTLACIGPCDATCQQNVDGTVVGNPQTDFENVAVCKPDDDKPGAPDQCIRVDRQSGCAIGGKFYLGDGPDEEGGPCSGGATMIASLLLLLTCFL